MRIRDVDDYLGQFLIFFATLDPVGTLALFVGLTAASPDEERRRIALRAVLYSAAILVAAILVGQVLLGSLGIRLAAFQLAGGLIFFLFGVQMVFGSGPLSGEAGIDADHDVAVFPLAVPSIASPGAILACVVLTDNREYSISEQAISTLMLLAAVYQGHTWWTGHLDSVLNTESTEASRRVGLGTDSGRRRRTSPADARRPLRGRRVPHGVRV